MDQPKLERMLRLMMLMSGTRHYTINELAAALDTTYRSIYHYIDTFKAAGFVVRKNGNIFRLDKESRFFKDISQLIHFTDEEAYVVNRLIDSLHDNNLLKQNLRRKLASVYNFTAIAECVVNDRDASNVHTLISAIEQKKQVLLKSYASSSSAEIRDRLVEPFAFTANYVQTWCYDPEERLCKTFKTARMQSVEMLQTAWQYADQHKQQEADLFRHNGERTIPVKLKLNMRAKNLLIEEFPLAEKEITKIDETHWLLSTKVCRLEGVARFVMGLLADIELVDSPELRQYIQHYLQENKLKIS